MQDGVSAHRAKGTMEDLDERGICVQWPGYSLDLNPIEMVWKWMKDWIQDRYDDQLVSYDPRRRAVTEGWDAVPADFLREQLHFMPVRWIHSILVLIRRLAWRLSIGNSNY
jgi:hypothetical protein